MKTRIRLAITFALGFGIAFAETVSAATVHGKIKFVGTLNASSGEGFRVMVEPSTCDSDPTPKVRWLHVRSDHDTPINGANLRNAYSTAMAAFLSTNSVQVDWVPSCDASGAQEISLGELQIAIEK